MRKVSVPINIDTITEENLPRYLESVKNCKVDRVFLIGFWPLFSKSSLVFRDPEKIAYVLGEFKKVVKEVGFWESTLGHGKALNFMDEILGPRHYTPIEGVDGQISEQGYCPSDENFRRDLGDGIEALAKFGPDIIMLDDDFRFHHRSYYMGCFCPHHLKEFYKRIGEEVPREKLEKLIWSGGENKYRTAYMHMLGDSLVDLARELRGRIDRVDPTIRFGCSITHEIWDADGIDPLELGRAFAGNTAPFTRVCCAPYWNDNITMALETTRLEFAWCRGSGVEVMSEGDTYPRPRYNCASKPLELFDLMLIANNPEDGLLNYIYEYNYGPDYETGYEKRYLKNEGLRQEVAHMFGGKDPVGVQVFQPMHMVEKMELPQEPPRAIHKKLVKFYSAQSHKLLSENTIPTCFADTGYPVLLVGESAKYIDPETLTNGAILDVRSAEILTRRGVDVGFVEAEPCDASAEVFLSDNDKVKNLKSTGVYALRCKESAEVLSLFQPGDQASAYKYENAQGQRFFVLGYDAYFGEYSSNYLNNYYRQAQLANVIQWACGKKLPAYCPKHPRLYMLASRNEEAMAVALANIFLDDVLEPEIILDKTYSKIRFINCTGKLLGDRVILSDIPPYGFAAFEVM